MKKIIALAAFAVAFTAAPALAQDASDSAFTGPRVTAIVGNNFVKNAPDQLVYGGQIGFDVDMNGAVIGVTGEYSDTNKTGRDLAAGLRVGGTWDGQNLIYGHGGYTNLHTGGFELEGYRLGAGVEHQMGKFTVGAEYRYSNYGNKSLKTHGVVGTVGFRF